MFNRILSSRMCSYRELKQCSMRDVYNMLLILDWNDYAQAYAESIQEANK